MYIPKEDSLIFWSFPNSRKRMEEETFTIGEFARLLEVSPRTIDFYTRRGLLHPEQTGRGHGYRRYTEEDRKRVSLIKQLQTRKFSLREIRQILNSHSKGDGTSAVEAMEQVAIDLEKLQSLVEETRPATVSELNQPAVRTVATKALQRATALCSVLVTLLQDLPPG
jgi:MerR family copper efflux transcriptional regulator